MKVNKNLQEFQHNIDYFFNNIDLLRQALTTPLFANEMGMKDYEVLETIGDAVIKLIFLIKKYKEGIREPGIITIIKQSLENDETLNLIGRKFFQLSKYIIKSDTQEIRNTKIIADVFEAVCGAIYLDSNEDLKMVEEKIVNRCYNDWNKLVKKSRIFNKNILLEYLQSKLKFTPKIIPAFHSVGPDNKIKWIAKNPKIYDDKSNLLEELTDEINHLESNLSKTQKNAEQNLYLKIYQVLKRRI